MRPRRSGHPTGRNVVCFSMIPRFLPQLALLNAEWHAERSNKKAAFTSTLGGGRVLIRITRVHLFYGVVLSVVRPFLESGERARPC